MGHYNVCIVGAGSIGANKPDHVDSPISDNILTHAHAVSFHQGTELHSIVDSDPEQLRKAVTKWQPKRAFLSLGDLENDPEKPDIFIVSVPTEFHYKIIPQIFDMNPKLIIAEKPFCSNLEEVEIINEESKDTYFTQQEKQIPIAVNYIRRFSTGHQQIKTEIDNDTWGKILNCRVLYTRGLKHEGCHAIDLMHWFFGDCLDYYIENDPFGKSIVDRDDNDPTCYVKFEFEKCPNVVFQPCDGRQYGIFEIDICFEKARIRLIDNGLYYEIYPVTDENEWGHKSLSYKLTDVIRKETRLNFAMYYLIENAVNFLDGKEKLLCTIDDAIKVHKILKEI